VNVPIQLSPSLSPSSLLENDSISRDATKGTSIDFSLSSHTDLVDLRKTKQDESKKGDDTSQPSIFEPVHELIAYFPNRLRNKKD